MKNVLVGMLLASVFIVPAMADSRHGHSGGSAPATGGADSATSSSTATGGAGGAGGTGTGGAATGGSATGGTATGGAATGGRSNASGNTSTVTVSLTNAGGTGSSGGSGTSAAADPGASTVSYDGSYTVRSAPPIAAPSLTSTFSDTCMGSASFGLSFVGFGATAGSTMVDDACVRRLDSREFRAMGLNDVALALLCQSPANKKAVEATGRACPSAGGGNDTAAADAAITLGKTSAKATPATEKQASLAVVKETPQVTPEPAAAPAIAATPAPAAQPEQLAKAPEPASVANTEAQPMEVHADSVEVNPLPDAANLEK
jgi:hypothetical protein